MYQSMGITVADVWEETVDRWTMKQAIVQGGIALSFSAMDEGEPLPRSGPTVARLIDHCGHRDPRPRTPAPPQPSTGSPTGPRAPWP